MGYLVQLVSPLDPASMYDPGALIFLNKNMNAAKWD
jgi:hypothetical protein